MYNHTTIGGFYIMAKFSMKDYEDFMEEEKRQDQLQEELEDKRRDEDMKSDGSWYDYQVWLREQQQEKLYRLQEEERRREYYEYFDERDFDDGDPYCMADLLDTDVPDDDCDHDDDCDDDDCDDDDLADDLYNSYSEFDTEDIVLEQRIAKKSNEMNQQEDRICRKAVARNRHLNKVKAKKSRAQKANYVAKREMRKCCKVYRNLDKAYLKLANKADSYEYLPYSMYQNMERRVNATLDQMSDIVLKAHYFECLLGAPMYKQALSAPKAM